MLLSSCVVWRYRDWETLPRRVPGRRPGAPADRLGGPRRRARLARVAGRARRRAGDGEPAHDRRALRPARADRASRCARDVRLGEPLPRFPTACPTILATGGFQGDPELVRRYVTPEPLVLRARTRGAPGTACASRSGAAPSSPRGWTSSTGATSPPRRASSPTTSCAWRRSTRGMRRVENARRRALRRRALGRSRRRPVDGAPAGRARLVRRPRRGAGGARPGAHRRRDRSRPPALAGAPVERRDGATRVEVVAGDHVDARRHPRRRAGPRRGGPLGGGRRRRRHLHRRLVERARRGPRPRQAPPPRTPSRNAALPGGATRSGGTRTGARRPGAATGRPSRP